MIYNHILWILQNFCQTTLYFQLWKEKKRVSLDLFFICLGFLLSHCMNTAGFLTNYIILSLHVVWTISPNTVWSGVQNYKYSIFNVYLQFWILFTSSTSVIIHTCIHVHQIKLVNCSTLCNLVLWWMYSHVARLKILFFVFVLCSWNDPKGKRIWGLVSICSLLFFSLFILCLYIKVKKYSIIGQMSVGLNYYRRVCVCDMQSVSCEIVCAHAHVREHFSRYFELPTAWKSFPEWHIIFKLYIHNFLISVSIPMKA